MVSESGNRTPVLDHGYSEVVETWGSDERIIEAARMSTAKGFQGWGTSEQPGDEKLLRFLWTNAHHTPFEMAGATFEIQAPIFVFREWHRHRTQSYNELSARYTPVPDVNYLPTVERLFLASGTNKQAQGLHGITSEPGNARAWLHDVEDFYQRAEHLYQMGLNMGLPKEIARIVMPVGRYSRMRASANLRNWLGFLKLRTAPNAQWEIRQYAHAVEAQLAEHFPRTLALFRGHVDAE